MDIIKIYDNNIKEVDKKGVAYDNSQGRCEIFFSRIKTTLSNVLMNKTEHFIQWFENLPLHVQTNFLDLGQDILSNIEMTLFDYSSFKVIFINIPNNSTDNILYKKYSLLQKWIPRSNWFVIDKSKSFKTVSGLNKFFKLRSKNPISKKKIFRRVSVSIKQDGEFVLISPIIINSKKRYLIATKTDHVIFSIDQFYKKEINVSLINCYNLQEAVICFHEFCMKNNFKFKFKTKKTESYFFELLNWRRICPRNITPGKLKLIPLLKRNFTNSKE